MRLFVITACDAPAADKTGRKMAGIPLDAILCGNTEKEKSTADAILKHQEKLDSTEIPAELCENSALTDREHAKAIKDMLFERFTKSEKVAVVMPAEFFGNSFGTVIMRISDEAIDNGAAFGCYEGAISSFAIGDRTEADYVNRTLHLKVSEPEMIKEL
ncbi:MAG: hypothetical protein IKV54_02610 [Clostridia bacterium]|nr:hypothetical protein [Clostridia bacterium]